MVAYAWLGQSQKAPPSDSPAADKIRAALDTPITLNVKQAPLNEILKEVESRTGLTIHSIEGNRPLTIRVQNMSTGALLQLVEDQASLQCFVRDYGLLVLPSDRGVVPRGAVPVHDFWKSGKKENKEQSGK